MIAAERIRTGISAIELADHTPVSASIGLPTYPDDPLTAPELLDAADHTMCTKSSARRQPYPAWRPKARASEPSISRSFQVAIKPRHRATPCGEC